MAEWVQRQLGDDVVNSLTAAKITTGTLSAGTTITVGDPLGVHTELGQSSLRVFRPDPDGDLTPTASLGGADRDVIQLVHPDTGATMAGFDSDGAGVAQTFSTNVLEVAGQRLGDPYDPEDTLWGFPRGTVGSYSQDTSAQTAGNVALGVCEVAAQVQGGRLYRVQWSGVVLWGQAGIIRLQLSDTMDGTPPKVDSYQRLFVNEWLGINSSKQVAVQAFFTPGSDPDLWYTYRCLFSTWTQSAGQTVQAFGQSNMRMTMTVEDVGPVGAQFMKSGQPSGGGGKTAAAPTVVVPPPATAVKTETRKFACSWSRAFQSVGGWRTDTSDICQGYYSGARGIQRTMIGFPPSVASFVAGSTITSIKFTMYAYHWYGQTGVALLGAHSAASLPSSFSSSGQVVVSNWKRGTSRTVSLPSTWFAGFLSGNTKGITVGAAATTSSGYYGRFYGYGTPQAPTLEITCTK